MLFLLIIFITLTFYYIQGNMDKWMIIPDMGYVIANKYNVILVCLSLVQNMTILQLRSTPPVDIRQHRMISI